MNQEEVVTFDLDFDIYEALMQLEEDHHSAT
jgi:hypothetical protein